MTESTDLTEDQKLVLDALEKHKHDPWYHTLLVSAIEETRDAKKAIEIADQAFKEHPADPSKPQEDDVKALFEKGK